VHAVALIMVLPTAAIDQQAIALKLALVTTVTA
jgi:hypothetical protein